VKRKSYSCSSAKKNWSVKAPAQALEKNRAKKLQVLFGFLIKLLHLFKIKGKVRILKSPS
jgi:hypothetical protein